MASPDLSAILEQEKNGTLSEEKKAALAELRRRGAIPMQAAQQQRTPLAESYGAQAAKNFLPSLGNKFVGLYEAAKNPAMALEGLASPMAGGVVTGLQKLGVPVKPEAARDQQAFAEFVRPLVESFRNPAGVPQRMLEKTAEDPAGALMNASMLTQGLGKLTGSSALKNAGAAIDPINASITAGGKLAQGAGRVAREGLGFTTGKRNIVNQMYETLKAGGDAADEARQYLRGKLGAEDVVNEYKGTLRGIRDEQLSTFQSDLKKLSKDPSSSIDITGLKDEVLKKLDDYNVKTTAKGELDFSRSKAFAADPQGQADVRQMVDIIKGWGRKPGDTSPYMLDTLRGILGDFYSPSAKSREFAAALKSIVKDAISSKVDGYSEMLQKYEKRQEIFEESKKLFSMQNPNDRRVNADLVLKKLQRAMTEDPELARQFLDKIQKESGKDIKSIVAAYSMSPMTPSGIVGRGMLGGALYETARNGLSFDPHTAILLGAASPRWVGETLNIAAKAARGVEKAADTVKQHTAARQAAIVGAEAAKEPDAPNTDKRDALNALMDRFQSADRKEQETMRPNLARSMRKLKSLGIEAEDRKAILKRWASMSGDI